MDAIHHAMIGAIGMACAASWGLPVEGAAFLLGSVAPDLDALVGIQGKIRYLQAHQAATHSIALLIPFAAAVAGATLACAEAVSDGALSASFPGCMAASATAIAVHCLLDACNSFGIRPLWPWGRRICLDAVFFIDFPLLILTAGTLAAALLLSQSGSVAVALPAGYATAFSVYAAARWWMGRRLRDRLQAVTVIPSGIDPVGYHFTRLAAGGVETGYASGLTGACQRRLLIPTPPAQVVEAAGTSEVFVALQSLLRGFVPVSFKLDDSGQVAEIVARDVAVPHFGARFGETTIRFRDGRLESEHARI